MGGSVAIYILMRLELPSGGTIGPGRIAILEGIDRFGSITAAARSVGLTYRQVWNVVQILNEMFDDPLIEVRRAGRSGGALLTPLGKQIVARFRELELAADKSLSRKLSTLEKLVGENPKAPKRRPRWVEVWEPESDPKTKTRTKKKR
jgi:molybdate transport system regulatory protein